MGEWGAWIGREEVRRDRVDAGLVARWCATLDREVPGDGAAPQGVHWCLGLPDAATAALGEDGHPRRDDAPQSFLPPVPLPRRMWAASQVEFLAPLRMGEEVERVSRITEIEEKTGRSGRLVFVSVMHETRSPQGPCVRETQEIVYREAAAADAILAPSEPGIVRFDAGRHEVLRTIVPQPPLLFRYSALTFNSHRIHYDLPYAREIERYRGLVVHGPLTASLLLDLARRERGDNGLRTFAFRGISPAIAGEPLHLTLKRERTGTALGAFAEDGRQVMAAVAEF